jgi:protein-S-isoprenylcysteine O-methyltransferase Ste14
MLFSLALMLISQNWLVACLGIAVIPLLYVDIMQADRHEIEKFGDDYRRYMEKVPRTNFLWGIVILLIRWIKEKD